MCITRVTGSNLFEKQTERIFLTSSYDFLFNPKRVILDHLIKMFACGESESK